MYNIVIVYVLVFNFTNIDITLSQLNYRYF